MKLRRDKATIRRIPGAATLYLCVKYLVRKITIDINDTKLAKRARGNTYTAVFHGRADFQDGGLVESGA